MESAKIRIKFFGPIKEGFKDSSDGFFLVNKLTVLIGDQGSGKSTIAKIISTFKWLEKSLFRDDINSNDFTTKDFLSLCKNQNLTEYFQDNTQIEYCSEFYNFTYKNKSFAIVKYNNTSRYLRPQIMYFPSERNLISVIEHSEKIQNLPPMLDNLLGEFIKARKNSENGVFTLPVLDYKMIYDKNKDVTKILEVKSDKEVLLSSASSGLQSIVPLSIVMQSLEKNVKEIIFNKLKGKSQVEKNQMQKTIRDYFGIAFEDKAENLLSKLDTFFQSGLTKQFSDTEEQSLTVLLGNYFNTISFYVVEELEQNLFPISQVSVLEELIKTLNSNIRNSLVITTHSPYILSALNNYIYASSFGEKANSIVSSDLQISNKCISAYIIQNGSIKSIMNKQLELIDTTVIDDCSSIINEINDKLYALETE